MTLLIIAFLVSLGYILSCIKAGSLASKKTTHHLYVWNGKTYDAVECCPDCGYPRRDCTCRGWLARLLISSKQIT